MAYKLKLPITFQIHLVLHVSLLKNKVGRNAVPITVLPVADHGGRIQLEPMAVLDRRMINEVGGGPRPGVLLKWCHFDGRGA
ncbi:hypothetical protein ACH5RR_018697 [Cinchona calisaya]|uniref:Uncharacterized protein n=1 Tax=Cinchona calisaya TaxID=153742 RepID=A0ABD2ZSC5_9GENT